MSFRLLFVFLWCFIAHGQEGEQKPFSLDGNFFYGSILLHNDNIAHLITGHPTGFVLSYNRRTYGFKAWEERYNYPDYGASFVYQDLHNQYLGHNFSVYGHFNFYALNRKLMLRIGQGVAMTTEPFDIDKNFQNIAYGSRLMSSTMIMLNYKQPSIFERIGLQAGVTIVHYSNANVKAPNSSTNTLAFNLGLNYQMEPEDFPDYIHREKEPYSEPVKFNLVIRGGVNESDYIGLGQKGFVVLSAFADKKINHKSTLQAGLELFLSPFLKEEIKYLALAFPEKNISGNEDWKRAGVFVGHELRFNKNALVTQAGYYYYYDYDFKGRVYFRGGLKRYFTENIFAAITLKSHFAQAEAVEFGLGYRW